MIKFEKEDGGHINFEYDTEKYYAVCQSGTSVPNYEGELVYVPVKKCRCSNSACTKQEYYFIEDEVLSCPVLLSHSETNTQPYADIYTCWVSVQLYDKDEVLRNCPAGYIPAIVTINDELFYHVHEFLN